MARMKGVLLEADRRVAALAAERKAQGQPPPLVLMYGHSMAGAAISVLTGQGKVRWAARRSCWRFPLHELFSSALGRQGASSECYVPMPPRPQVVDGETFLGFDGKYILPNATPVYLHRA